MEFYTLKDLADRWTVTRPTAREYTRDADFPPCLDLSGSTLRWPVDEVLAWESRRRTSSRRRRRVLPYTGAAMPMPTVVREFA